MDPRGTVLRSVADRVEIAPGVMMPRLGLGTSRSLGEDVVREVESGFALGYRLIDTAAVYGNERDIGRALARTDVARGDIFVTTKVWNSDQGYESTLRAFEASRSRLGLDHIDLYLIHWPQAGRTADTWHALERLHSEGLVRAIGVCNFESNDLETLVEMANVPPAIDQVELHPGMPRIDVRAACERHGIMVQAWAPVMRGYVGDVSELARIAAKHGKSAAQTAIRWILQHGITTIPKSVHPARLAEDADVFDIELTDEEMARIDGIEAGHRASRIAHSMAIHLGGLQRPQR